MSIGMLKKTAVGAVFAFAGLGVSDVATGSDYIHSIFTKVASIGQKDCPNGHRILDNGGSAPPDVVCAMPIANLERAP